MLKQATANQEMWKGVKALFDIKVDKDNLKVTYMRTMMTLAGPVGGQDKRYESVEDDKDAQTDVVIDFSGEVFDLTESDDPKY